MAGEGTALGYGAAVLPKSTFDPTEFGEKVAAVEAVKKNAKKAKAEKDKQTAIDQLNPEIGKLKWTSPYVNKYEEKMKEYRDKNVKWLGDQEGQLSQEQLQANRIFQEETKGEYTLLNTTYDNLIKTQQKIQTNKEFNTPENTAEIERVLNPYENDAEGLAEYDGDILKYLAAKPAKINPKAESYDLNTDLKSYREAFKPSKTIGATTTDEFGNAITPSTKSFDLNAVAVAAGEKFDNDPSIQSRYETREKYQAAITNGLSEKEQTQSVTKAPTDGSGGFDFNFGGGSFSGKKGVVVTEGKSEFEVAGKDPSAENLFKEIGKRDIDTKVYSISNNGKPFKVSGMLPVSYSWGSKGLQKKKGGNFNTTISSIMTLPMTTADVSINDIAEGIPKTLLKDIAVDGIIPAGTVLSSSQSKVLKDLKQDVEDKYFGIGETTGVRAVDSRDGVKPKKVALSSTLFPMEDLSVYLENQGLKFNYQKPEQKEEAVSTEKPKEENTSGYLMEIPEIKSYVDKGWIVQKSKSTGVTRLYNKKTKESKIIKK